MHPVAPAMPDDIGSAVGLSRRRKRSITLRWMRAMRYPWKASPSNTMNHVTAALDCGTAQARIAGADVTTRHVAVRPRQPTASLTALAACAAVVFSKRAVRGTSQTSTPTTMAPPASRRPESAPSPAGFAPIAPLSAPAATVRFSHTASASTPTVGSHQANDRISSPRKIRHHVRTM